MWPSAGALTTISTPMLPFAPGRFSTTKGWAKPLLKSAASARARKSTEPPGGLVATMRTARLGQAGCAIEFTGSASDSIAKPRMGNRRPGTRTGHRDCKYAVSMRSSQS